jgi:DNA primase catalytic subunit
LSELETGRYDRIPEIVSIEKSSTERSRISKQADPNTKAVGMNRIETVKSPLIEGIIKHLAIHMEAEDTDKMVTIDTSRLIRLPDSIHGGSGLLAKTVIDLEKFDPLTDALAFGKNPMKITIRRKVPVFDLGGEKLGPFEEGVIEVPEYAGMYLLLRLKDDADAVKQIG